MWLQTYLQKIPQDGKAYTLVLVSLLLKHFSLLTVPLKCYLDVIWLNVIFPGILLYIWLSNCSLILHLTHAQGYQTLCQFHLFLYGIHKSEGNCTCGSIYSQQEHTRDISLDLCPAQMVLTTRRVLFIISLGVSIPEKWR